MQWQANSIILSSKLFSENSRIATVFNSEYGKCRGLVRSSRITMQMGDFSQIIWKAKTIDSLGLFKIENIFSPFVHVIDDIFSINAIESACCLCCKGLPDRAPHPELFEILKQLFVSKNRLEWIMNYVNFELNYLFCVGLGLDLSKCAITGQQENLYYMSPKTGRCVIKEVGDKYSDKLFVIPKQQYVGIIGNIKDMDYAEIDAYHIYDTAYSWLKITEHFLRIYFYGISNIELPLSRNYLLTELLQNMNNVMGQVV